MDTLKLTFGTVGSVDFSVSAKQNNYDDLVKIVMEESGPKSYLIHLLDGQKYDSVFPVFKAVDQPCYFKFKHGNKTSNIIKVPKSGKISSFPIDDTVYGLEILNVGKQTAFESKGGHVLKNLVVSFGVMTVDEDVTGIRRNSRRRYHSYAYERDRLDSFSDGWDGGVSMHDLARWGFYRVSNVEARCHFCRLGVTDWESTDTARGEHVRWNPDCPFLVRDGRFCGNVVLGDEDDHGDVQCDGISTDGGGSTKTAENATVALNTTSKDTYRSSSFKTPSIMKERTFTFRFEPPTRPQVVDGLYVSE